MLALDIPRIVYHGIHLQPAEDPMAAVLALRHAKKTTVYPSVSLPPIGGPTTVVLALRHANSSVSQTLLTLYRESDDDGVNSDMLTKVVSLCPLTSYQGPNGGGVSSLECQQWCISVSTHNLWRPNDGGVSSQGTNDGLSRYPLAVYRKPNDGIVSSLACRQQRCII